MDISSEQERITPNRLCGEHFVLGDKDKLHVSIDHTRKTRQEVKSKSTPSSESQVARMN